MIEGRVLLAAGKYADVLSNLNELKADGLSQAALTYQAAAFLKMNETDEAWRIVEQIRLHDVREPMFPADEKLLQIVQNQLAEMTTVLRTQEARVDKF